MKKDFNLKKELVLERFKTLNPESKISLGGHKEVTVKELIKHVKKEDEFGKNVVKAQIKMLQVLSSGI
tara:strand:+ start:7143 stop:7346 length:204 start_codon:yes stop_codon:yes gene_type:complete